MLMWDCTDCGKTRHAGCSPVCLPAARINRQEFKSERIARERLAADQALTGGAS